MEAFVSTYHLPVASKIHSDSGSVTILYRSSLLVLAADHSPDVGDLPQVLTFLDQYVTQNPRTGYARKPRVGVASLDVRRGHPLQVRQGGMSNGVKVNQQV